MGALGGAFGVVARFYEADIIMVDADVVWVRL
jgi:hypothetical protein